MRWTEYSLPSYPPLPDIHPLLSQALARRGITTPEAAQAFLDPSRYSPSPSSMLPGIEAAVERLVSAVRTQEKIYVWGDFDVDGQTATTLLVQTLRSVGADVAYHLPVRSREGHGVNIPILQGALDRGMQLILTCDTGISAHEAAEYARSRGVDMIITDHHDLPPRLPKARAIIDPKMLPAGHPLSTLAGVGVAYKLAEVLLKELEGNIEAADLTDLAALGLVSDLAILTSDARYLVQKGLAALRHTQRLGLQTLCELVELQPEVINESHIGFTIGPRLNALGRLGDANPIVDFLLTTDSQRARVLATQLENFNAQRRLLTAQVTQAAEARLRAEPSLLAAPIIIVGHPSWPAGVLGIAAARLVERYNKPAIVYSSPPGEPAYGSARSVDGLHITEAIAMQSDLLRNFGGHPMAAGLSIDPENLSVFYKRMIWTVEKMLGTTEKLEPTLAIDSWIPFPELTLELAGILEQLAPFGPGNPKLVIASKDLTLTESVLMGRNKEHRKLIVADAEGNSRQVLWWDGSTGDLPEGKFDLAYTFRLSNWKGEPQTELEFVAFQNVAGGNIPVTRRKLDVIDFRSNQDKKKLLASAKELPSALIWAEGNEKDQIGGRDRCEFTPADTLIIWTIPPSAEELRTALEAIDPKTVWLVAAHPHVEITENFIARLTGLIKYAILHHQGLVTYPRLAAATGQRLDTVRSGIAWLVARGLFTVRQDKEDELWLAEESSVHNPPEAARSWLELQSLLAETAAYRSHFKRAGKDTLFS